MTKHAQLPDGTVLEFPDDTPDDVMDKAVRAHLGANTSDFANMVSGKKKPGVYEQFRKDLSMMPHGGLAGGALDLMDAAQHHIINPLRGFGQLGAHGLEWGLEHLGLDRAAAAQHAVNVKNDADIRDREASYQRRNKDSAASYTGATVGEVLPWMYGLGELRALGALPAAKAGLAGLAAKGGLLAAEGGTMGAAQPVTGEGDYAAQKGTQVAVGAVTAPALAGGLGGLGALSRFATPAGRDAIANERVAKLFGDNPDAIAALRQDSGVAGYNLTPAQANPSPEMVQIERTLRNNPNTAPAMAARESANNLAARNAVQRVAQAPEGQGADVAMDAARQARTAATQPFRERFMPEEGAPLVDPAPVVSVLQKLALSGTDTVRQAAKKHLALLQEHMAQNGGKITTTALDDIRQGVGSTLRSIPQHGSVTPKEVVLYAPVSSAITDTLERAIPGYRAHLAAYARHSQPINDMEAGRALLSAIDSGGRDAGGNQVVSLAAVKQMIRRDNNAEFPMSEPARRQIEAVLEALQKRTISHNSIAAAGPGTAADVQRAIQASPLLMRILGHGAGVAGGFQFGPLGYLAGAAATEGAAALNNSIATRVGAKAASAQGAADAIEAARRQQVMPWLEPLLPYTRPALPPPR